MPTSSLTHPMAVKNKLAPSREAGQLQRKSSNIRALALPQGIRDQITKDLVHIFDLLDTSVEIPAWRSSTFLDNSFLEILFTLAMKGLDKVSQKLSLWH